MSNETSVNTTFNIDFGSGVTIKKILIVGGGGVVQVIQQMEVQVVVVVVVLELNLQI